ncbi:MAG: hypothetical protein ACRDJ5_09770, partial [Actinomycetota bacterium]
MERGNRARRIGALCACLVFGIAAACGGSPTSGGGSSSELDDFKSETADRLEEITSELEGLDPEKRRARLVEMAEKEGGSFNLYGSTNLDEAGPLIEEFEDSYDITVNYYRANSEDVLQRVVE